MGNYYDSHVYVNTCTVWNNAQGENLIGYIGGNPGLRPITLKIPTLAGLGIDLTQWTQRNTGTAANPNWQPQWCKIVTPQDKFNFNNTPFTLLGVFPKSSETGAQIGMGFTQPKIMVGAYTKTTYFSSDSDIVGGDSSLEASSTAFGSVRTSYDTSSPRVNRRIVPTGYQFVVIDDGTVGLLNLDSTPFFTDELFEGYYPILNETWKLNVEGEPSEGYNYLNFLRNGLESVSMSSWSMNGRFIITNLNNPTSSNKKALIFANTSLDAKKTNSYEDTAFSAGISGDLTKMAAIGMDVKNSNTFASRPINIPCQDPNTLTMVQNQVNTYIARPNSNTLDNSIFWETGGASQSYFIGPWTLVWDETNDHWYVLSFSYYLNSNMDKACYLTLQQIDIPYSSAYPTYLTTLFNLQEPEPGPTPPDPEWEDDDTEVTGGGDNPYEGHEIDTVIGGDGDYTPATTTTDAATSNSHAETIATLGGLYLYHLQTGDVALYQQTLYKYLEGRKNSLLISGIYQDFYNALKDGMIDLFAVPVDVSSLDGTAVTFAVGNVGILTPSAQPWDFSPAYETVSPLTKNILQLSDITLPTVGRYYGSFLDYEPYSTFKIFIPYYGETQVEASKVYGHTLKLSYRIDLTTGDFLCILMSDDFQIGTFTGNCAYKIRIVQNDIGTIAQTLGRSLAKTVSAAVTGGASNIGFDAIEAGQANVPAHVDLIGTGVGGSIGWLGSQYPYITRTRAIADIPASYEKLDGLPLRMTSKLSAANLVGTHIKVEACHVRCSGTLEEKAEIEALLKEGVVL